MKFFDRIKNLQQNNVLVVLRTIGSAYQKQLLADLGDDYRLIDLSLPNIRLQVEQNPELFVQGLQWPVYLANLHYTPQLLPALLASNLPLGQIIASCTQNYYLQEAYAKVQEDAYIKEERLASFIEMPLADAQEEQFVPTEAVLARLGTRSARSNILQCIVAGNDAFSSKDELAGYISRVLQQDIMERTTVSDSSKFYRFLCTAATMAGTVLNYTTLASTVDITPPTAKQWLRFLAGTGMVYLLQPVENVPGKRLMKAPKLYFRDTGVACQLLQLADANALIQSVYFKKLYENYVVNLLRESYLANGLVWDCCFYRDSNAKEISLVLQNGQNVHPIAIDKDGISENKLRKSFAILEGYAAANGLKLGTGCELLLGGECQRLGQGLWKINSAVL